MAKMSKGVIVEFDFTVLNGAEILFDTAKKLLKGAGVELNTRLEALHLAGGNYQGGLAELFEATGRSGDAAALARELNTAFNSAVAAKAADAVTPAFKGFLKTLAMECPFEENEFINGDRSQLEERSFQLAMEAFTRKTERIQSTAWPIIKQIQENQGAMYEYIMVPVTDGKRVYNIRCNLKEAYDTECKSVVKEFEKSILLHIIDDNWKENLRQLDELRHSVQNASYEQKDPLLIFKLESVKLWDTMIDDMNNRTVSILMRGQIPEMQQQDVQEAAPEQRSQRYNEQKDDLSDPNQQAAAHRDTREGAQQVNRTPIVKDKMPGRNDPCPCGSGKKFKNCHGRGL